MAETETKLPTETSEEPAEMNNIPDQENLPPITPGVTHRSGARAFYLLTVQKIDPHPSLQPDEYLWMAASLFATRFKCSRHSLHQIS